MLDTNAHDSFESTDRAERLRSINASAWLELLTALEVEFRPKLQPDREPRES